MTKHGKRKAAVGTLYLTATHLIFVDPDCSKETWVSIFGHCATIFSIRLYHLLCQVCEGVVLKVYLAVPEHS